MRSAMELDYCRRRAKLLYWEYHPAYLGLSFSICIFWVYGLPFAFCLCTVTIIQTLPKELFSTLILIFDDSV